MVNLTPTMEDYLKAVYHLHKNELSGAVHISTVAKRLGVSKPSVCRATDFLARKGLLRKDKYKVIHLTAEGICQAEFITERYTVIERFLNEVLLMDVNIAQNDACSMEHAISNECYQCMRVYLDKH